MKVGTAVALMAIGVYLMFWNQGFFYFNGGLAIILLGALILGYVKYDKQEKERELLGHGIR